MITADRLARYWHNMGPVNAIINIVLLGVLVRVLVIITGGDAWIFGFFGAGLILAPRLALTPMILHAGAVLRIFQYVSFAVLGVWLAGLTGLIVIPGLAWLALFFIVCLSTGVHWWIYSDPRIATPRGLAGG